MTDFDQFERRLAAALRSDADQSVFPFEAGRIARAAIAGTRPARRFGRGRGMTLLAAAALLLVGGALATGSGVVRRPAVVPPIPAPSLAAVTTTSPEAPFPSPSEVAAASPSPTAAPIIWTQASLKQDWPAPVRPEPAGSASVAPMPPTYIDPSGDTGSTATGYVDIRDVTASTDWLSFTLASKRPSADPSTTWIAYGLVIDEDRDGVPDWRYGMDNVPSAMAKDAHRAWRTNIHTGVTEFDPDPEPNGWGVRGDPLFMVGTAQFGTGYTVSRPRFRFYDHGDVAGGGTYVAGARQDKPFYVWASVIQDGRVVATDYAPDTGWLVPSTQGDDVGAAPGTYVLEAPVAGPLRISMNVPAGWTTSGPTLRTSTGDGLAIEFLVPDQPAEWACDSSGHAIKPSVGPTVDDLVTFLARQSMLKITDDTDVTVDGYRGTYLEYTTFYNGNDNCEPPAWPFDIDAHTSFHRVWMIDVDGVRLVIDASAPKASEGAKAEFGQIVDSIAIGP